MPQATRTRRLHSHPRTADILDASVRPLSPGNDGTRVEHVHEHKRFDEEAATWDDDPGHEKRQVAVAQAITEAVDLSPRMSAVDLGGGTGRLSILLADLVGSVVVALVLVAAVVLAVRSLF